MSRTWAIAASVGSTNRPTRGGPPAIRPDSAAAVSRRHGAGGGRKEHEPNPVGTGLDRGVEGDRVIDAADLYLGHRIPAAMSAAAMPGSRAAVIGRPTTIQSAPAAIACAGVMVRAWSPEAAPSGRMPGTTSLTAGPSA